MPPTKAAAFFDLDKTVIATSSFTALTGEFLARGVTTRRALLRTAFAQAAFLLGSSSERDERLRTLTTELVRGWDAAQVRAIARETLARAITPKVYAEALNLIATHRAAGRDIVVVSASGIEVVEPIAQMLGADHTLATEMQVVDGRYTGEMAFYCHAESKPVAMRRLAEKEEYDLDASFAYSDSITDAPMLRAVGHAAVVNPTKALRALAQEEGWPALAFTHTRDLTRHVPRGLLVGGLAAGLAAAAFAAGWRAGSSRT